jgi:transcriptional adapter 2-alpha
LINEIGGRASSERDPTPQVNGAAVNGNVARPRSETSYLNSLIRHAYFDPVAQPLNLSNSPSLALLDPAEQTLCSQLRILPKPYLAIKHALVDAFNKSGGTLRKREARELVKIDVNKTARIWDFLEMKGLLRPPEIENREASGTVTQSQGGESS